MLVSVFSFWFIILSLLFLVLAVLIFSVKFSRQNIGVLAGVLVALPLVTLGLYWHWGAWRGLEQHWRDTQNAAQVKAELAQVKNPQQVVDQLVDFLKQHPKAAKGWYLLGKIDMGRRDYPAAVSALQKAVSFDPKALLYQTAYVEASFFAAGNRLDASIRARIQHILAKDPSNAAVINLLAIDAYNRGHYRVATAQWERLLKQFPPNSRDAQILYKMIAKAQQH